MRMSFKQSLFVGSSIAAFVVAAGPAFAQQSAANEAETVIVTGTRVQGMTAADSAAPITVLGTDALTKGTGSTDLRQALGQMVPSFTAQQFGGDTANLTLSAALRGLSPNDTLVLVNGKRRHYTGNLQVDGGSFTSGSSAADISLIPEASIDHVEVLLDGAAAQYGTDAIAGVVNIILKNKSSGGTISATAGDYYDRGGVDTSNGLKAGGTTYDLSANMGLPLFDKGAPWRHGRDYHDLGKTFHTC
jgi:iron complex outermembrane receptor protein